MTQTYSTPWLEVESRDRAQWQACQIRGQEQRLTVAVLKTPWHEHVQYQCGVTSSKSERLIYEVVANTYFRWRPDGSTVRRTQIRCGCDAGRSGQPCKHAALVMTELGIWPFPIGVQLEATIEA